MEFTDMDDTSIHVPFDSVFWKIHASRLHIPRECPLVKLEWGWTAGMSKEELQEIAPDAPSGNESVITTIDWAIELRDQLNRIIEEVQAEELDARKELKE